MTPVKHFLPFFVHRVQGSKSRLGETSRPLVERMPRLLCTALIVAFAVCTATTLTGNPDDRHSSGETRTVDEYASFLPQRSGKDGATVNAILRSEEHTSELQ